MDGKRLIRSIRLENILSYGPETPAFDLEPLNVLVGPNASGKSNLIEALSILAAAPRDIQVPFRKGGGVGEWLWKGAEDSEIAATIEVTIGGWSQQMPLVYRLSFIETWARFEIHDEVVEAKHIGMPDSGPTLHYGYRDGYWPISEDDVARFDEFPGSFDINDDQSILSQRRDPRSFPELSYVASLFEYMRFYREFPPWSQRASAPAAAGRSSPGPSSGRRFESCRGIELSAEPTADKRIDTTPHAGILPVDCAHSSPHTGWYRTGLL